MSTCDLQRAIRTMDITRKVLGDLIFDIDHDALSRYTETERVTLSQVALNGGGPSLS